MLGRRIDVSHDGEPRPAGDGLLLCLPLAYQRLPGEVRPLLGFLDGVEPADRWELKTCHEAHTLIQSQGTTAVIPRKREPIRAGP